MISEMVLQMMFVFGDKNAFRTEEQLLWFDVTPAMLPELQLGHSHKLALLTFKCLDFSLRVDPRHTDLNISIVNTSRKYFLVTIVEYDNDCCD